MKDKSEIINDIIKEVGAESYLEIGYGTGHNFNKIDLLVKTGIDPDYKGDDLRVLVRTSDDFFKEALQNGNFQADVIFIDGLHHCDQVRRDIVNAMRCGAKVVLLHDTYPPDEAHQIVPRKQKQWCGDCWRSAVGFHKNYPNVRMETYKADYGLTVIYPEGKKYKKHFEDTEMSFEYFKKNAVELLNIVD